MTPSLHHPKEWVQVLGVLVLVVLVQVLGAKWCQVEVVRRS
jgi:hypothetical protein